jgi:hypothetical protein
MKGLQPKVATTNNDFLFHHILYVILPILSNIMGLAEYEHFGHTQLGTGRRREEEKWINLQRLLNIICIIYFILCSRYSSNKTCNYQSGGIVLSIPRTS